MSASLGVAAVPREPAADTRRGPPRRILVVSNGHGEDTIAGSVIDELLPHLPGGVAIEAWPLVGAGGAYVHRGVPLVAQGTDLPSEGFGTLSAAAFLRDLHAGWLRAHLRQLQLARHLRGRYELALAVGDVVPMLAATLSETPFAFVGCAKSVYFGPRAGYGAVERALLRRRAVVAYPRDRMTAGALARRGINVRYLGNPMMDGLAASPTPIPSLDGGAVVAVLPGSRRDREENAGRLLAFIAAARATYAATGVRHFAFALPDGFDMTAMRRALAGHGAADAWAFDAGFGGASCGPPPLRATFHRAALGDVCAKARVAIGLAGTANEQAVGLGVPVVTFATAGAHGDAYLRMKMPFFGASAVRVAPDAAALAEAVSRIVRDDTLHTRMAAAGRERMGLPGASAAIAEDLVVRLERLARPRR